MVEVVYSVTKCDEKNIELTFTNGSYPLDFIRYIAEKEFPGIPFSEISIAVHRHWFQKKLVMIHNPPKK